MVDPFQNNFISQFKIKRKIPSVYVETLSKLENLDTLITQSNQ